MTEYKPEHDETERLIHNGEIINDIAGVKTEAAPARPIPSQPMVRREVPQSVEDIDPEALAGLMARVISDALAEAPAPSPMEIVTRLLVLKTDKGHKVVWTRFDINQLFALWTNKLERQRMSR